MMEAIYIKNEKLKRTYNELIPNTDNSAFVFRIFKDQFIHDYRHIHAEYELIYVKHGSGTKNIGDLNLPCKTGDISLIGSAIPHHYQLNPDKNQRNVEVWVIQFDKNFLGSMFFDYSESRFLKKLITASSNGVTFKNKINTKAVSLLNELRSSKKEEQVIIFLQLLNVLSAGFSTILNSYEAVTIIDNRAERLMSVKNHIAKKFAEPITVNEMAKLVHLSKSAFCNLFKKRFNICFSEYLNEFRISKASKMLAETDKSINDIWGQCGFSNQSYFNRVFKKYYGANPNQYRKILNP